MGILLWVVGALAVASGVIKLRSKTTRIVGRSPLALAETILGLSVVLGAGAGLARHRALAWLAVVAAMAVVVGSAVSHGRLITQRAEERERSAERRLRRHLGLPER